MTKNVIIIFIFIFILGSCSNNIETQYNSEQINIRLSGSVTDYNEEKISQLSELVGYELNYTTGNGVDAQKIYLEISNNEQYDVFKTSTLVFSNMYDQEQVLDLSPYLEKYAPNLFNNIDNWGICEDEQTGGIYCIPDYYDLEVASNVIYYNTDELSFSDEVVSLEDFKEQICSNSEFTFPYYTNHASVYYDYVIRQSFEVGNDWNKINGEYIHISEDDNYYEYLEYMSDLYKCGALGDYQFTTNDEQFNSINNIDSIATSTNYYNSEELSMNPGFLVALSSNGEYYIDNNSNSLNAVSFVPIYMEENIEEILTKLDSFYKPETLNSIYEDEHFTNYDTISYLPANPTVYKNYNNINNENILMDETLYNEIKEYDVENNELSNIVFSNNYFEQQNCINTTMIVFSNNYILGVDSIDTKDDLILDLNQTCGLDEVTKQVNTELN